MSKKGLLIVIFAFLAIISNSVVFANEPAKTATKVQSQKETVKKDCTTKVVEKKETPKNQKSETKPVAVAAKSSIPCEKDMEHCKSKKVVFVNIDLIWKTSPKGKEELAKLEKNLDDSKAEAVKMKKELDDLKTSYEKTTDEKTKDEISKKIEVKRKELIDYGTLKTKEIEFYKNKAQNDFISEIMPIINQYRETNGYLMIKRFNANEVLSIDPKIDVTKAIMELYNK